MKKGAWRKVWTMRERFLKYVFYYMRNLIYSEFFCQISSNSKYGILMLLSIMNLSYSICNFYSKLDYEFLLVFNYRNHIFKLTNVCILKWYSSRHSLYQYQININLSIYRNRSRFWPISTCIEYFYYKFANIWILQIFVINDHSRSKGEQK
jgi:hypothetical protein